MLNNQWFSTTRKFQSGLILEEQLSREDLLGEIEVLRQEIEELKREKADLEILLETTTEHSDTLEAELYDEAEKAVRASDRRLAQFLEAMPVGVAVLDAQGRLYYSNQKAQQLFGKAIPLGSEAEQFAEIYQFYLAQTNQLYPCEKLPIVRALQGVTATADNLEFHQADKIIPIESWGTPIFDEQGNIIYAIAVFQDITERQKAELERLKFTEELRELNKAYERFVPRQFLQLLEKKSIVDVQLGAQVLKEMSVLFSDIRDFTSLSESMTPADNFKFINSYLSGMEPAIIANRGFIDKFMGDEIMALFSGCADDALKAGIAMLHRLNQYNQGRAKAGYATINVGIGINTGALMLGTVGVDNRMDSTVISDAVNLASRLEGLTKDYGVPLLISHETFIRLQDANQYAMRLIDRVKVKGKSEMVSVFEVFDADPLALREGKLFTKKTFEEALSIYKLNSRSKAAQMFEECLSINPGDTVARIYLERCQYIC